RLEDRRHSAPGRPEETRDRQKDNCGWDLESMRDTRPLCVAVKGLSGSEIIVELTPKEYAAMKLAMTGGFSEGEYRLAVVRNALTAPELLLSGPRRRMGLDVRTHVQMHPHHRATCRPLSRPVSQQLICSPCAGREVDMVVTGTCASHEGT